MFLLQSTSWALGWHKAKGLEFDTVHVLDDFVKVPCARPTSHSCPTSESVSRQSLPCGAALLFWDGVASGRILLLEQKGPPGPKCIIPRLWFLEN